MYDKAKTGDSLTIRAEDWNAAMDAALAKRGELVPFGAPGSVGPGSRSVVKVKNASSQPMARFSAVNLTVPVLIGSDQNLSEFQRQATFSVFTNPGTQPANGARAIGVLLQDLDAGVIGDALVAGAVPVQVNITDVTHLFADLTPNQPYLTSGATGPVPILYPRNAVGETTGIQWCYVLLGPNPATQSLTVQAGTGGGANYHAINYMHFMSPDFTITGTDGTGDIEVFWQGLNVGYSSVWSGNTPTNTAYSKKLYFDTDQYGASPPGPFHIDTTSFLVTILSTSYTQPGKVDLSVGQVMGAGYKRFRDGIAVSEDGSGGSGGAAPAPYSANGNTYIGLGIQTWPANIICTEGIAATGALGIYLPSTITGGVTVRSGAYLYPGAMYTQPSGQGFYATTVGNRYTQTGGAGGNVELALDASIMGCVLGPKLPYHNGSLSTNFPNNWSGAQYGLTDGTSCWLAAQNGTLADGSVVGGGLIMSIGNIGATLNLP